MKLIPRQKIWLAIVVAANLALWIVPSDVVEQIARDRHTMLGRYSRPHFSWIVGAFVVSVISFYIDWSTAATYRKRWFQVIAVLFFLTPAVVLIDALCPSPQRDHYVRDGVAYHHPKGRAFAVEEEDRPRARRTYPNAPPGYGTTKYTAHTDRWGFRNQTAPDECDVVVLGDSFAEGSGVPDESVWPVRLANRSDLTVYNLGMSGYAPINYKASLREYGLPLNPRLVLCMLYEGNDFRSAGRDRKHTRPSLSKRIGIYFKQSPLVDAVDNFLISAFGPINCNGSVDGIEILDWLPLRVPAGPDANHYTFAPKQLRDMVMTREAFARDRHWLNCRVHLDEMSKLCRKAGAAFVLVYAPTKAHVLLPVVAEGLPAEKVRAFTAISYKKKLPALATFLTELTNRASSRESVVAGWCDAESILFLAVTPALRRAAVAGTQVYFTYDQHWTPDGHEVVAEAVNRFLQDNVP